ncbi:MAG: rhomboid family intramembrane serine protease [Planctomycetes bacterium]|nr:rhomboid family intramembrane serine protease [Planctomycetota bacterium]
MRQCPRCFYPLKIVGDGTSELAQCHRCHGAWVLPREAIRRFGLGADPATWEKLNIAESRGVSSLMCPDGHGALAVLILRDEQGAVEVDTCAQCEGLWLDAHEGRALSNIARRQGKRKDPYSPDVKGYLFQLLTGFPVEEWNPVRRTPVVMLSLLGAILAAAVAQIVFMYLRPLEEQLAFVDAMFVVPATILDGGAPWTLFTYMFFHIGIVHLLGNLWFLWLFGDNVEDALGRGKALTLYLAAGLVGGLAHIVAFPTDTTPLVGASGAIAGLMGAYLVLFPRIRVWVVWFFFPIRLHATTYLLIWIGLQFLGMLLGQRDIAWWVHIGGFTAGVLMALMLRDGSRDRDLIKAAQPVRPRRAQAWERPAHVNRRRYTSRSAPRED